MIKHMKSLLFPIYCFLLSIPAYAVQNFPPPDFTTGHKLPVTPTPQPRAEWFAYMDIGVLIAALMLATYFVLWKRSRRAIGGLSIFSLAYFGFYRHGCVCSIGAIQNVAQSIADPNVVLPVVAGAFFLLPLIFALFAGRVFCAAVCPLGAAQDIVLMKPTKVPNWLAQCLGILPWIYLGVAVMYASIGSAYLICRYDPFVAFFRFGGSVPMLVFGGLMLVLSMFVGRAYCRFLCPYGALLRLISPLTKWKVTITPDECVNCRLCEDACPYGEIRYPTPTDGGISRTEGKSRLITLLLLLPVFIGLGAGLGYLASDKLAQVDPAVSLARRVWLEDHHKVKGTTLETDSVRKRDIPKQEVYLQALAVGRKYRHGSLALGGWIGLIIGLKLIGLSIRRRRSDYEADAAGCVACGRCYMSCPVERVRHGDAEAKKILEEYRAK